ncbi:MAG TPA: hypothetical protein VM345_19910 [Acidimicrobiales bacterium]|jgi:hypothetical protein|nr:hypothetical protein [Acidimicrobiales bacterium]
MTSGCALPPATAHEWVSFEDDEEERTWVFDVTFLTSRWTCIFGNGCQGVLTGPAPELVQGCCSYGAHFTDDEDLAKIERIAAEMPAEHWQFREKGITKKGNVRIARVNKDGDTITRQVEDACIFLNRPGFANGPGCALHQYAIAKGDRPLDLKPNVCWQLPLRREDADDGDGHVTSTLRQWDRKHWGAGGSEFHWWCTEEPDAFVDRRPVYETLRDEIIELVGQKPYDRLVAYLESRKATTYLPHPAVRRND